MAKYKVGDKVRVREDLEYGEKYYMENGRSWCPYVVSKEMHKLRGQVVTITEALPYAYGVTGFGERWFTDEMFEGLVEETTKNFKVKLVDYAPGSTERLFTIGKVYEVKNNCIYSDCGYKYDSWSLERNGNADFEALKKWFSNWYVFELVEEKKVFTKNDLKTGMFGVMGNGKRFVVVGDNLIYQDGHFDRVSGLSNDLKFSTKGIDKVYEGVLSFNNLDAHIAGHASNPVTLVYDRGRDTKRLYNGKVVCIDLNGTNEHLYTVGKIYQFVDGSFVADNGEEVKTLYHPVESFEEWKKRSNSKWLEIKE